MRVGVERTRETLVRRVQSLLGGRQTLDASTLQRIEEVLLEGDVGVQTTEAIVRHLREVGLQGAANSAADLMDVLKAEVARALGVEVAGHAADGGGAAGGVPHVVMVVGVNGAGKTTTVGKLAHRYRSSGARVIIGAADTYRAAAGEQLNVWAERAGVEIVRHRDGGDPAAVAFDMLTAACVRKAGVAIVDTAGRLHNNPGLMDELKKVERTLGKVLPGAPHEVLLVLDAGTGQNGLQQAKKFHEALNVTGIVLTKLDGTAKGGIVLAIHRELTIPVKYVSVGEGIDDLQPFDKELFLTALFQDFGVREVVRP